MIMSNRGDGTKHAFMVVRRSSNENVVITITIVSLFFRILQNRNDPFSGTSEGPSTPDTKVLVTTSLSYLDDHHLDDGRSIISPPLTIPYQNLLYRTLILSVSCLVSCPRTYGLTSQPEIKFLTTLS